jgi:hypothetical protein
MASAARCSNANCVERPQRLFNLGFLEPEKFAAASREAQGTKLTGFCCCSTVHFDKYRSFYDQQMHTLLT